MTYANWIGVIGYPLLMIGIFGRYNPETDFILTMIGICLLATKDTLIAQSIRKLKRFVKEEKEEWKHKKN